MTAIATGWVSLLEHPFGKGALTTDGLQYGTAKTAVPAASGYVSVEQATLHKLRGGTLQELELGLTMAVKSSNSVETVLWKFQASDDGNNWEDLITGQTAASGAAISAYADKTISGRFAPTGNFLCTGRQYYVRGVVSCASTASTGTVDAKVKNTSYILPIYRQW